MTAPQQMAVTSAPKDRTAEAAEQSRSLADLKRGAQLLRSLSIRDRKQLLEQCVVGVQEHWTSWIEKAWQAKRIEEGDVARAEDIMTGPIPTLRYLQLLKQTLIDIDRSGQPQFPSKPFVRSGRVRVPVFPTQNLFDRWLFGPFSAQVRMQQGVTEDALFGQQIAKATGNHNGPSRVSLVLGAGNVSSIPITDALTKIFQDGQAVMLKMSPVNEYVGEVFEKAFAPLVKADLLRVTYGDAEAGAALIASDDVDCVHITGSDRTHDAIVWGGDRETQIQRKAISKKKLLKPITSELGNVSPWIIVPGRYSKRQLRFQAENIVASVTSNASFVCIATKMLITCRNWPQRQQFLDMIDEIFASIPRRYAYYPGAPERFARFAGKEVEGDYLPWELRRNVNLDDHPELFRDESFACVFGETSLDADSPAEFFNKAVDFANQEMWGTLSAAVTVPNDYSSHGAESVANIVDRLRYGTIGINQWPGVAFALMSTPWGAFPGSTAEDIQSGTGSVHNTYLLDRFDQTVLSSPLTVFPKPMWFSTHRCPEAVARNLLNLYLYPSFGKMIPVVGRALMG